jgi:hypothetical protein
LINDSTLCRVAKKLRGLAPDVVIDDPVKVEELLQLWWRDLIDETPSALAAAEAIENDEDEYALNTWVVAAAKYKR